MKLLEKEKIEKEMLMKTTNTLLEEKQKLIEKNDNLNQQVEQLQKSMQQTSETIVQMKADNKKKIENIIPVDALRKIFTTGQIKMLMSQNKQTRVTWSADDITSAIALKSISPRAYKYLRNIRNMLLPCITTLHNWCAGFTIPTGILKDVLQIMKEKGKDLCTQEKVTVLSFDEIYISNKIDLERKEQKIYGPHKTCQVVMARGLFQKWKQPIYYDFDKPMSTDTLIKIIKSLYEINYIVGCDE